MSLRVRLRWMALLGVVGLWSAGCDWHWPWESKSAPVAQHTAPPPAPRSDPLVPEPKRMAMVNQEAIALDDVETSVRELKQLARAYGQEWKPLPAQDDPNALDLHDVVTNLILLEVKAQDAKARHLETNPDVQRRWAYLQRNFLAQEWDRVQREGAAPTEEEIHKFYEDYKLGFLDPERVQVRQIVTATLAEAEALRARAVQGAVFQQLAAEASLGEGKEKGGDVGWFLRQPDKDRLTAMGMNPTENAFFPQLEPVAFALEKDQISQPVKGPEAHYYIVQLVERKPGRQRTELEVHDGIKETLILQKMQKQVEDLRKKATIKEFPERLSTVEQ